MSGKKPGQIARSPQCASQRGNHRNQGIRALVPAQQIRSFAGTLNEVGCGRWTADDVSDALAARDRKACGPVAPPYGLYLVGVDYPSVT
ncbi:hypothetical protein KC219_22100, partial [Mycobacterium tuberculosis]|nr:hypothetical protein [Mycobacterium tuberculosis]